MFGLVEFFLSVFYPSELENHICSLCQTRHADRDKGPKVPPTPAVEKGAPHLCVSPWPGPTHPSICSYTTICILCFSEQLYPAVSIGQYDHKCLSCLCNSVKPPPPQSFPHEEQRMISLCSWTLNNTGLRDTDP